MIVSSKRCLRPWVDRLFQRHQFSQAGGNFWWMLRRNYTSLGGGSRLRHSEQLMSACCPSSSPVDVELGAWSQGRYQGRPSRATSQQGGRREAPQAPVRAARKPVRGAKREAGRLSWPGACARGPRAPISRISCPGWSLPSDDWYVRPVLPSSCVRAPHRTAFCS
jgi:hypothetical protein